MTHSLTGNNDANINNLKGFSYSQKPPISIQIKQIKEKIVENYLVPLFAKQWEQLNENSFFIENIQNKISFYYKNYHLDELIAYHELLRVIKLLVENNKTLDTYEKQHNYQTQANQVTSMVFKTTKIRLLPEYEIYDSILGKPKKELQEKYDEHIISIIKTLLDKENCTYNKIKNKLQPFMM
jgi:hypothetical protein